MLVAQNDHSIQSFFSEMTEQRKQTLLEKKIYWIKTFKQVIWTFWNIAIFLH